jgi:hypothetical protein
MTKISLSQINGVAVTAFALCIVLGALLTVSVHRPAPVIVGLSLGAYLLDKRRPNGNGRRESFSVKGKLKLPTSLSRRRPPTPKIRQLCSFAR